MNKKNIFIVLKNIFAMWYANFLFVFVSSTWITFWYEQLKDGLSCPKNNVGMLCFLECLSQNNPRGQKSFSKGNH